MSVEEFLAPRNDAEFEMLRNPGRHSLRRHQPQRRAVRGSDMPHPTETQLRVFNTSHKMTRKKVLGFLVTQKLSKLTNIQCNLAKCELDNPPLTPVQRTLAQAEHDTSIDT